MVNIINKGLEVVEEVEKKKPRSTAGLGLWRGYGTRNSTKDAVGSKQNGAKVMKLSYYR